MASPKAPGREVCLQLFERVERDGPVTVIGETVTPDKNSNKPLSVLTR